MPVDGRRARLAAVRAQGTLNGFEGVEAEDDGRTLLVRCLHPVPEGLTVAVTGGVRRPVRVEWARPSAELGPRMLVVRTAAAGDFSAYQLTVTDPVRFGFDPVLARIGVSFTEDRPDGFDPRPPAPAPVTAPWTPAGDYLDRDYAGLRQRLLDRMALLLPGWTDRNPADVGVTILEIFAYLGDQLAYAQDAVATEAYLGTARRRVSVRRHARLLGHRMHEGAAARVFLTFGVTAAADGTVLDTGTEAGTGEPGGVFHTLHPVTARHARNAIGFHAWGDEFAVLDAGATEATLVGGTGLGLAAGDVLILEDTRDAALRHPVRLAADPVPETDPLSDTALVRVRWHAGDATPFPLRLWPGVTVARGNVALAEHGTLAGPEPLVPAVVPDRGRYRPRLAGTGLAHAVPYTHGDALTRPAAAALDVRPQDAVPAVVALTDGTTRWTVVPDLVGAGRFTPWCVAETEDDGRALLRFGDGVDGRAPSPGSAFTVTYRTGGGPAGNVGRDALTRLAVPIAGVTVRNPLPARGGAAPEPTAQARQVAPVAHRRGPRAVTDADHADLATTHPRVRRAVAARVWTGSWYTESVVVDPARADDATLRDQVAALLDRHRMAGGDVRVSTAARVPLDIVLTVHVAPGHRGQDVRRALADRFGAYFHPDELGFGRPIHLSALIATAMSVTGVARVDTGAGRLQRWGRPAAGEWESGVLRVGAREVPVCLSDPNRPEHGRIDFRMVEGA
ncbi:baseplate J/gp47 family protein [Catenuloplanes japonicus]|uniref:baseplate J/gp47 family protein n=1 Tax=Catenuloplanes japonicus TaxID=33876 RepID=UPI00068D7C3E|nr:baseplate J/gp47 family protein [Catenuloplanes japonicus]